MKRIANLLIALLMTAAAASAQSAPPAEERKQAPDPAAETIDIFDLLRKLRHKERRCPGQSPGTIASR